MSWQSLIQKCIPYSFLNTKKEIRQALFSRIYFNTNWHQKPIQSNCLLQLLLGAKVVGVSTLLLAAVDSTGVQTGVTPAKKVIWSQLKIILKLCDNHCNIIDINKIIY